MRLLLLRRAHLALLGVAVGFAYCAAVAADLSAGRPLELIADLQLAAAAAAPSERPRLIPLVAAESGYAQNSSVNLLCTVSQGRQPLHFEWFRDGHALQGVAEAAAATSAELVAAPPLIERHADHSLLRIARVSQSHAGRYTCTAKNQFGQDSSSVQLLVNGKNSLVFAAAYAADANKHQSLDQNNNKRLLLLRAQL